MKKEYYKNLISIPIGDVEEDDDSRISDYKCLLMIRMQLYLVCNEVNCEVNTIDKIPSLILKQDYFNNNIKIKNTDIIVNLGEWEYDPVLESFYDENKLEKLIYKIKGVNE